MLRNRSFIAFSMLFLCSFAALAQTPSNSEQLFSPSVGRKFYEIAYELANPEDASQPQLQQAITFLTAAITLDNRANYAVPDMIKFASRHIGRNHSDLVYSLLLNYVDDSADLEVTEKAVRYLLEQLDSREQREKLLAALLTDLGQKNAALDSELSTLLALLMAEKADSQSASSLLMRAFNNNKYNRLAFEKLTELVPEQIEPVMYLQHFRWALAENPLDIENALTFANYAERLQLYQTAADAYNYCADLFQFLYPDQPLPPQIYLPWAISNYNTRRNQHACLQIAEKLRQSGQFDLVLEAIAAKAAIKTGNHQQAKQIFRDAEDKARNLFLADEQPATQTKSPTLPRGPTFETGVNAEKLAWFYCFANPDPGKALDWANKTYATNSDSATAAALLAYSLVMNGQNDWAKPLIETYRQNQIASLTLAQIQLQQGDKDSAIENLKSAIASDPASLVAELAKHILTDTGGVYIPPIDPDITLAALQSTFGQTVVPSFVNPEKIISLQLNVRGSKFYYNNEFGAAVIITNNSAESLIISDNGLFNGNIRIDADITGDINQKIPRLVSTRIRPSLPLKPGASIIVPVRLLTAQLRRILLNYPQAALDIQFTVYLDPVISALGLKNRLPNLEPPNVAISRPGVNITGRFLRNRFNSLASGQQGQKMQITQLFIGLLAEQNAMANREPLYKFMYAEWMPALLKSALVHNLNSDDWIAKTHTMAGMLSLPMDYELINAAAENLNDTHWPVRMMAIYLLTTKQQDNFARVLDWTAKYDSNNLVRQMAIDLGAAEPPQPPLSPLDNNQQEENAIYNPTILQ